KACFLQALAEGSHEVRGVSERGVTQETNNRHRRLLPAHGERPSSHRAAEQRDEFASLHSITSSARASNVGGISRPRAFAVVRLMTRSNLVGCSTGRSPGFAPRRIMSTKSPARRNWFGKLGP